MPKFFITNQSIKKDKIEITGKDVNHIKNVLRKKTGEIINLCNTDTSENYLCEITQIEGEKIQLKLIEKTEEKYESNIKVSIFQGLPKANKMELIIQKAVELGVYNITPVEMRRSVVKLNEKDKIKKIQRWQTISEVASKQCGRDIIPEINNVSTIGDICKVCSNYDILIVAYENEKENKLKFEIEKLKQKKLDNLKIAILIGPEGGIDDSEIKL